MAAWVLVVSATGLHVLDEALSNFLDFYNPLVVGLRDSLGFFPMPTFPFRLWLAGLIIAVVIGFALAPVVNKGSRFIRILATVIGIIMVGNGLGHMLGSLYVGRLLPGFWSSPFLLAAAVYVVARGFWGKWQHTG